MQNNFSLKNPPVKCFVTNETSFEVVYKYYSRPLGETEFKISAQYYRELWRFLNTGHFISLHDLDIGDIYKKNYVESTYGNEQKLNDFFSKIVNLPQNKSDNSNRVLAVNSFFENYDDNLEKNVMDIGSGICVFLWKMNQYGWKCTALDPDKIQSRHASNLGFDVIHSDFLNLKKYNKKYNLITFNKVLEHVLDPILMLNHAKKFLNDKGLIYLELPDCENAWLHIDNALREEFFIEHHHGFSKKSIEVLAKRSRLEILELYNVLEPSGKFTFRGFLRKT